MRTYPYYIVQWYEGRLECPIQHRMIPAIRRQFESGRIGGRRNIERQTTDPKEAYQIWQRNRNKHGIAVYIVEAPNRQRKKIMRPYTLNAPATH